MRESVIESYLVKQVKALHGEIRKVKWINRNGAPDRLVWLPYWNFPKLAELKAPGKPLEVHQRREQKRLRKMGFICRKLDSFENVNRFLKLDSFENINRFLSR
jgi:hypothetical protein